ncbi:unnamed protein product [Orchesella dallaii]|uniref:Uncharacterized protein n=1 Tax=Orchesella dallaii TaxID=48710 RepID=A0ABP1PX15_9HEXA
MSSGVAEGKGNPSQYFTAGFATSPGNNLGVRVPICTPPLVLVRFDFKNFICILKFFLPVISQRGHLNFLIEGGILGKWLIVGEASSEFGFTLVIQQHAEHRQRI